MSIVIENLSFTYGKKGPYEKKALSNVSLTINDGECVGIVGSTGSGKSTLVQHLNGLVRIQEGKIAVDDIDLSVKKPNLQALRKKIGMLFQYPEYQLFAETVLQDVCFGPTNFGMSKEEAKESAKEAIEMVGLDFEEIKERSPIELSGGQKRRVAIAGVLAYKPSILILDEPTAGLDPIGKKEMLDLISSLRKNGTVKTVIMVSHNMDEIAEYTDRVIALHNGVLLCDKTPEDFFYDEDVKSFNLDYPHAVKITKALLSRGVDIGSRPLTKDALLSDLIRFFETKRRAE
ncbi:MAG: energy-coupling factor transporter ATPase [Clostridia bacterium]|nr:energy-coupling factor transporter ATPase [Clostridia bacterium]